jgi:hypothetical protein
MPSSQAATDHERLLGHLLGVDRDAHDGERQSVDAALEAVDEMGRRLGITGGVAREESLVGHLPHAFCTPPECQRISRHPASTANPVPWGNPGEKSARRSGT